MIILKKVVTNAMNIKVTLKLTGSYAYLSCRLTTLLLMLKQSYRVLVHGTLEGTSSLYILQATQK